jgi:hypothetical protein
MPSFLGEILTRATALGAFVCYVMALALALPLTQRTTTNSTGRPVGRLFWTAGCIVFLIHVASAFHFQHHWSHAAAYRATAAQTVAIVGLDWGGGLYFNYAFTLLWVADVLWLRIFPQSYSRRDGWIKYSLQIFFAFMWLNATVVFGGPIARASGIAATLLLTWLWWKSRTRGKI